MTTQNENGYLSAAEAAETLKLSKQRICGLCAEGKLLGAKKLGGIMWCIPEKSVLDYSTPLKGFARDKARREAERLAKRNAINAAIRHGKALKQKQTATQEKEAAQS